MLRCSRSPLTLTDCRRQDYVSVGLMFAALVLICGFIKVYTERQQRLKLRDMAAINECVSSGFRV